jgi:hypothetical protein
MWIHIQTFEKKIDVLIYSDKHTWIYMVDACGCPIDSTTAATGTV